MEKRQFHIGSKITVPNRSIRPPPVWLPYTHASFGQHKLWNKKSIILSLTHLLTASLCLAWTLPHTHHVQMKNVRGRPPGYSTPGQRKISLSSSMRCSVQRVLCPTHISLPLDRHVLGQFQASACSSICWIPVQGNLYQLHQFYRCKNVQQGEFEA